LPPEIEGRRAALARFLEDEVGPAERAARIGDEADASPELEGWVRARSAALGLYRVLQPADLGGGGVGPLGMVALHETVGRAGCVLGHLALGGDGGLLRFTSAAQRERFLWPVLRGEVTAALAFTDAREGPRTTAVSRGATFLVSGVKAFVTGGARADLLLTVAKVTEHPRGGVTGTALFVIPRNTPGVTLRREIRTLDGAVHGEFSLDQVEVPAEDMIGEIGQGLPRALESIAILRLRAAALACGAAGWALAYALDGARRPHRTGAPLGEREQVQAMLGESAIELYAARAAVYAAAARAEAGEDIETEAAMAKAVATETAARVVDRAMQLAGAAAVVDDHPLARLYRRIRPWRIAEGTTEILRLTVARRLLAPESPGPATIPAAHPATGGPTGHASE
jgi:alkylation response protein AidB-like acyl-CoA dehydrogenase